MSLCGVSRTCTTSTPAGPVSVSTRTRCLASCGLSSWTRAHQAGWMEISAQPANTSFSPWKLLLLFWAGCLTPIRGSKGSRFSADVIHGIIPKFSAWCWNIFTLSSGLLCPISRDGPTMQRTSLMPFAPNHLLRAVWGSLMVP